MGDKSWRDKILCWLGIHDWEHHQEMFRTCTYKTEQREVVIGWHQCRRCARSHLKQILV